MSPATKQTIHLCMAPMIWTKRTARIAARDRPARRSRPRPWPRRNPVVLPIRRRHVINAQRWILKPVSPVALTFLEQGKSPNLVMYLEAPADLYPVISGATWKQFIIPPTATCAVSAASRLTVKISAVGTIVSVTRVGLRRLPSSTSTHQGTFVSLNGRPWHQQRLRHKKPPLSTTIASRPVVLVNFIRLKRRPSPHSAF